MAFGPLGGNALKYILFGNCMNKLRTFKILHMFPQKVWIESDS
jgi:hypothetical protein